MLRLSVKECSGVEFEYLAEDAPNLSSDPGDQALLDLCEAVYRLEPGLLDRARKRVTDTHGAAAMIEALSIAAHFNAITKIADSTGIELEAVAVTTISDLHQQFRMGSKQPSSL